MKAIITLTTTLFFLSNYPPFSTPLPPSLRNYDPRISCEPKTRPPGSSFFVSCQEFLWELYIQAHKEPAGAYRWYGRHMDACNECVKLPVVVRSGKGQCAAVIDVDDENEQELSIFGLMDLWHALSDMVSVCWLKAGLDGRGYPDRQYAWAQFFEDLRPSLGEVPARGNGTGFVLDLSEDLTFNGTGKNRTGILNITGSDSSAAQRRI